METLPFEPPDGMEQVLIELQPHIRKFGEIIAQARSVSLGKYLEELVKADLAKRGPAIFKPSRYKVKVPVGVAEEDLLAPAKAKALGLVQRVHPTQELNEKVFSLTDEGRTTAEISARTGLGMSTIFRTRAKAGVHSKISPRNKLTPPSPTDTQPDQLPLQGEGETKAAT